VLADISTSYRFAIVALDYSSHQMEYCVVYAPSRDIAVVAYRSQRDMTSIVVLDCLETNYVFGLWAEMQSLPAEQELT